jgi:predicted PP-loop superfamily ATPase
MIGTVGFVGRGSMMATSDEYKALLIELRDCLHKMQTNNAQALAAVERMQRHIEEGVLPPRRRSCGGCSG